MFTINENININGFSLIEVVSVLLLLSIVSIIIVPRLFNTGADDAVTIDKIKTHLRYAKLRSMNSQVKWGVKFDNTSHAYWLFNTDVPNDEDDKIAFPGEPADQVTFIDTMTVSPALIAFDSLGRPFTDAAATTAFITENM
ncbi:MAG: type II secretion system GspH family protein, partial [Desulfobacula sp.]|nr:type II secretion system GspH family protein [Desulfobacula sp.]